MAIKTNADPEVSARLSKHVRLLENGWMRRRAPLFSLLATGAFFICSAQAQSVRKRDVECRPAPAVRDCGNPPKPDGLYRLKSRAKLSDGRDLCIDVDTGSGRYQQLECRNVPSSHFYFDSTNADHCYRIEQERSGGRETRASVAGIGINQVHLTCTPQAKSIQWQLVPVPGLPGYFQIKNQQTGKCIDADNNHLEPTGKITAQVCQSLNNQFWTLFQ